MAINPGARSKIVRDRKNVYRWVAQATCAAPPERFITTIAAATAFRTPT
jgi:hypothetical protein